MKALRWYAAGDLRLEDSPVPVPREDEALVRVAWTGLCGSDLEEYLVGPVVVDGPVVLGHEVVGTVEAPARDGSGPERGARVVVDVVTGCGRCFWCQRHEEGLCPSLVVTGQHRDGGLAEYVLGRASRLVPVPDDLPLEHAALAEPVAVAVRAVRRLRSVLGSEVLVLGGGTIGLLVAQVLQQAGATRVVVAEPDPWRRSIAEDMGVEALWAASETERAALVVTRYGPRGVDAALECSGARGAAREALRLVRRGGEVVLLGVPPQDELFDERDLVLGEKTVTGSAAHMWDDDVAVAVHLLATGSVDPAPLITRTVPLQDAAAAFDLLADRSQPQLKLLVDCAGGAPAR